MSFTAGQPPGITYVLVYQDENVGMFSTFQDAFDEGVQRYGAPPFTVIEERTVEGRSATVPELWTPTVIEFEPDYLPLQPEKLPWYKRSPNIGPEGVHDYPSS
jgi:hypothetical protein